MAGNEDFFFYDVSNAAAPKQLSKLSTPNRRAGGEAESAHDLVRPLRQHLLHGHARRHRHRHLGRHQRDRAQAPRGSSRSRASTTATTPRRSGASPGRGSTSTSAPPTTASRSSTRPTRRISRSPRRSPPRATAASAPARRRDRQRPGRHDAEGERRHRDAGHQRSDRADAARLADDHDQVVHRAVPPALRGHARPDPGLGRADEPEEHRHRHLADRDVQQRVRRVLGLQRRLPVPRTRAQEIGERRRAARRSPSPIRRA